VGLSQLVEASRANSFAFGRRRMVAGQRSRRLTSRFSGRRLRAAAERVIVSRIARS
jgi:hypothetical protein